MSRPPDAVERLSSFAELLAWAMSLWGDSEGGLLPRVRIRASRAQSIQEFAANGELMGALDFGTHPNNAHAQWFLRLGIAVREGHANSLDEIGYMLPGYKKANSANDWYRGQGLGDLYFGDFCAAVGIPVEVEDYLRERYARFLFGRKPKRFASIAFDQSKVEVAVRDSSDYLQEHPPVDRLRRTGQSAARSGKDSSAKGLLAGSYAHHPPTARVDNSTRSETDLSEGQLEALGLPNRVRLDAHVLGAELVAGSIVLDSSICDYAGVDLRTVVVNRVGNLTDVDTHPAFITSDMMASTTPTPNRPKAHLVDWQAPVIDQGDIVTLDIARSDYWTSEATRRSVLRIQSEVAEGRIDLMQLPRRLDVHLVVVCEVDNTLLLARRGSHVASEPSTWMITVGESMDWERDRNSSGVPHPDLTARHCLMERDELNLPPEIAESAEFRLVAIATEWAEMMANLIVVARIPGLSAPDARGHFRRGENSQLDAIDFEPGACVSLLGSASFAGSHGHGPHVPISDISRLALLAALRATYPLPEILAQAARLG